MGSELFEFRTDSNGLDGGRTIADEEGGGAARPVAGRERGDLAARARVSVESVSWERQLRLSVESVS